MQNEIGVSIITPLYNYARYIADNIKSVKKSGDFSNMEYEHIIIDDFSTDNPDIEVSKNIHNKATYIKREKNGGPSVTRNVGLRASKFCYVCFLDSDDLLTETSISDRISKLKNGYDLVHGPAWSCCNRDKKINKEWYEWPKMSKTNEAYRFIHAQGVCCKKDLFTKFGLFDENLIWKADRELWSRLINRGINIGTVESPVAYYRSHDKQWSKHPKKLKNNKRLTSELKKLIEIRKTNLSGLGFLT